MKSVLSILVLVALFSYSSDAQNRKLDPCFLLDTLLKQADSFNADKEFIKALNKLYSARVAARNCSYGNVNLVDDRIERVYRKVLDLKEEAEKASAEAINAKKLAVKERNKAQEAKRFAENSAKQAKIAATEARYAQIRANKAAYQADSSARITEASRLTTLALQIKDDDPTLALQLIKKGCDTSYFNYTVAIKTLHSILSTTHPASYYLNKFDLKDVDFSCAAMSENGQYLILGSYSGTIDVWDVANVSELGAGKPIATLVGHNGAVLSLASSADGSLFVSGGIDGAVHLWNNKLEKQAVALGKHTGAVLSVAISANKRFVVSSGEDKTVNVWNLADGTLEKKLHLPYGNAVQVCFSPGDTLIGIAGNDEVVQLWNWPRGNIIALLEGHIGAVRAVAFSPDGNYLVSGGDDKTVRVWDWKKRKTTHTLPGHQGAVMSVGFLSDGSGVVSASQDNTIKVWDLHTNSVSRELRGHQKPVFVAGFYKNGRYIYSGSYDRSVKLWEWKQDYMAHPPFKTVNTTKEQPDKRTLAAAREGLVQSDTTLFSHFIVTQGSDQTIWLWDSTNASRPAYILYNDDNATLSLLGKNSLIKSKELYQAFYQKLIRINGKLIPAMIPEDRSRFLRSSP